MRGEGLPSAAPLGPPARDAWHAYRDALEAGHRPAVPLAYARFLDRLGAEPAVVGERFCRWLCEGIFRHPGARPPYPLIRDVLLPYLVGGIVRGPAAPHLRWLAQLGLWVLEEDRRAPARLDEHGIDRITVLRAALVADPTDEVAWRMLFDDVLQTAAWGAHHMDSDKLVLPEDECLEALRRADEIRAALPPGVLHAEQLADHDEFARAFADWRRWTEAGRPGRFYDFSDARPPWV